MEVHKIIIKHLHSLDKNVCLFGGWFLRSSSGKTKGHILFDPSKKAIHTTNHRSLKRTYFSQEAII